MFSHPLKIQERQSMDVRQIMSGRVVTVEFDDDLALIKVIFDKLKFHHVLVVESHKLYGVISDRDLLKALSPNVGTAAETLKDTATLRKKAHQIMTRKPITLQPQATIDDAIDVFLTHRISCIPIVDDQLRPVGLVSWRDVLKAVAKKG